MELNFNFKEIISVSLILFSVIDILGSIPVVIDLRKKTGDIHAEQATLVSGGLMIAFLYVGKSILNLFGVDINSFAIAGALIIFLIGLEMTLGRNIFKSEDAAASKAASIVPLAFPVIAGAGTMTTILSLKSQFEEVNILVGILLNLVFIYIVLKASQWIEDRLGQVGANVLRKVFGVILLAISIKILKTRLAL
ncbi:MAG: MarC family protein [Arcicella sp.]|jgi:multiple antibiotic resistance protein|nr:MarC family protein [Arcicella sp.]